MSIEEGINLMEEETDKMETGALKAKLLEEFDQRRFDVNAPPPELEPLLRLKGIPIATSGNLIAVQGPAKVGKSAVIQAIMAAAMISDESVNEESKGESHGNS